MFTKELDLVPRDGANMRCQLLGAGRTTHNEAAMRNLRVSVEKMLNREQRLLQRTTILHDAAYYTLRLAPRCNSRALP